MANNDFDLMIDWYRISIGEQVQDPDIFFRFTASWVSLNGLYNFYCSRNNYSSGDKKKLQFFASNDLDAIQKHLELIQNDANYSSAVAVLQANGINDLKSGQNVGIADNTIFEEVILCVYQVRNNFFHGDKDVSIFRDVEVVTASHAIVSNFLQTYFEV